MPMTKCEECGAPAFQTESDADHGTPVYCSPECAGGDWRDEGRDDGVCSICNGSGMPGGVSGYPCPGCA